eukprot:SAG11_NODE_12863_length_682_cov_0.816467_1_plen_130_part_00
MKVERDTLLSVATAQNKQLLQALASSTEPITGGCGVTVISARQADSTRENAPPPGCQCIQWILGVEGVPDSPGHTGGGHDVERSRHEMAADSVARIWRSAAECWSRCVHKGRRGGHGAQYSMVSTIDQP